MFKHKLKHLLAIAALGCLAISADAQSRLGGPLVVGTDVGYYNNGIGMVSMPSPALYGYNMLQNRFPVNAQTWPLPMPADGTKVWLANNRAASTLTPSRVAQRWPLPLPADGSKVWLANRAGITQPIAGQQWPIPLPANGAKVWLSTAKR